MAREAGTDICLRMLQESKKSRFDSYSVRNSELVISHIILSGLSPAHFPTTFLEIAVYLTDTQQVLSGDSANVMKRNWIDATIVNRLNPHEHTSRQNCKYPMLRVRRF